MSGADLQGGEPCGASHSHIVLAAGEERELHYYLGVTKGALADYDRAVAETKETLSALRKEETARAQFEKLQVWWEKHLNVLQCEIPDADAEREINTWNPLQSVHTARQSRSISSDASGVRGIGFRDTAQDMLGQAYRKPIGRGICSDTLPLSSFRTDTPCIPHGRRKTDRKGILDV